MLISGSAIFKIVDTHGIPLSVVLHLAYEQGMIIDWYNFVRCGLDRNWNSKSLKSKILEALNEVYGPMPEFSMKIDNCFQYYYTSRGCQ